MKTKLRVRFGQAKKFRTAIVRGCKLRVPAAQVRDIAAIEQGMVRDDWRLNRLD